MEHRVSPSALSVVKLHWRAFAPAWVFPVFLLYGSVTAERTGHETLFFFCLAVPVFVWSFFRAVRPGLDEEAPVPYVVFWAMVVPFVIWGVAVFLRLAFS